MKFDPKAEGFTWPIKSEITNLDGVLIQIKPSVLKAGIEKAKSERAKECYRLYETKEKEKGLYSERELKNWQN